MKLEKYLKWVAEEAAGRPQPLAVRDYSAEIAAIDTNGLHTVSIEGINIARTSGARLKVFWKEN